MIHTAQRQVIVLKEHLARARNRMKMQADKKRKDLEHAVGDKVLLKLQPYALSYLSTGRSPSWLSSSMDLILWSSGLVVQRIVWIFLGIVSFTQYSMYHS